MGEHPAVRTVLAPYDSGHRGVRMGAGPEHLWDNGLQEALRSEYRPSLACADVHPETDPPAEVATAFELDRLVSDRVREAIAGDEFPLVLSGNCNTSVGTIAGVGTGGLGVVWFDAHADFDEGARPRRGAHVRGAARHPDEARRLKRFAEGLRPRAAHRGYRLQVTGKAKA